VLVEHYVGWRCGHAYGHWSSIVWRQSKRKAIGGFEVQCWKQLSQAHVKLLLGPVSLYGARNFRRRKFVAKLGFGVQKNFPAGAEQDALDIWVDWLALQRISDDSEPCGTLVRHRSTTFNDPNCFFFPPMSSQCRILYICSMFTKMSSTCRIPYVFSTFTIKFPVSETYFFCGLFSAQLL
jgi:hypothetical protein